MREAAKRRRYTYYHCTGYREKCGLPYIREEELGDRLGQVLKDIHIPDDILAQLQRALLSDKGRDERLLDAAKILELANKAYFLYVKQNHAERAKLLKMVLSNCEIGAVSLYPTYRKPFDLIFQKVKTEEWCPYKDWN